MGVGKVVKRPVYDAHGDLRPADMVYLSFSFDHRVVDGAVGAAFGNAVVRYLQAPALLLLPEKMRWREAARVRSSPPGVAPGPQGLRSGPPGWSAAEPLAGVVRCPGFAITRSPRRTSPLRLRAVSGARHQQPPGLLHLPARGAARLRGARARTTCRAFEAACRGAVPGREREASSSTTAGYFLPPLAVVVFAPFAALPWPAAKVLWAVGSSAFCGVLHRRGCR